MSILTQFFQRERKELFISTSQIQTLRRPSYPASDSASLLDATQRNELIFACISVRAQAAMDPRLIVEKRTRKDGELVYVEQPNHPFRALMTRPNATMTESDLMRAAIVSWDISNPRRAYFEKTIRRGLLTELHPLNPACMIPRYSAVGRRALIGYTWQDDSGYREEYSLDDLIIRTAPAWWNSPPLVAALGSAESDTAQTDLVRAFFENGGVPSGILKIKGTIPQGKADEIQAKWHAKYSLRQGGAQRVAILDDNADYQAIGSDLDKLASITLRMVAESRICMPFGVPPLIVYAYVGLLRATYSNLDSAWEWFWKATMSPAFKEWRMFWTQSLLSEFEDERTLRSEDVRLSYDMSNVDALQEDTDARHTRARLDYAAGGLTLNEYRAAIGEKPRPDGDMIKGATIPEGI